jgi:hypothetical protein
MNGSADFRGLLPVAAALSARAAAGHVRSAIRCAEAKREVASIAGMVSTPALASWPDVELAAPELARRGMARLKSAGVALLGTLRRDGSPRISPVDAHFTEGQLLIGAVAASAKTGDLRRDPR